MSEAKALLARYLRQLQELGGGEIFLSEDIREQLSTITAESSTNPSTPVLSGVSFEQPETPLTSDVQSSTSSAPVVLGSLEKVAAAAAVCTACGLASGRTTVVFGDGDPTAQLIVVGEAPGAEEDRSGRPFVGKAGKLLDMLLLSIGFPRETVYICNVLKCRPPSNRDPLPDEVQACSPFLRRQIEIVAPKAILAVGAFPAQTLLGRTEAISTLRGSVHEYDGIPLIPTYHPAALLRNPTWIRPVWEDLQRLRRLIDG